MYFIYIPSKESYIGIVNGKYNLVKSQLQAFKFAPADLNIAIGFLHYDYEFIQAF